VVIFVMLLAGFVPLLQVMFFMLLEDFYPGRLAMKDRDKTHRITGLILIMWYQSCSDTAVLLPLPKPKGIGLTVVTRSGSVD
jgi:hypothetical protein